MKYEQKFLLYVFIFYVSFFLIAFLNQERIANFMEKQIQAGGYVFILIFSLLMDILDQPLGPEIPAIIGIFFNLNYLYVFLFCAIGSVIGSLISLYFGRYVLSGKVGSLCKTEKYKKSCKIFKKYGNLSLFIASISPVPYVFFCWLSGAFNMKLRNFFFYGIFPRIIRIFLVVIIVKILFAQF